MRKLITARARKNKRTARMLANARKDHSIPLLNDQILNIHVFYFIFVHNYRTFLNILPNFNLVMTIN